MGPASSCGVTTVWRVQQSGRWGREGALDSWRHVLERILVLVLTDSPPAEGCQLPNTAFLHSCLWKFSSIRPHCLCMSISKSEVWRTDPQNSATTFPFSALDLVYSDLLHETSQNINQNKISPFLLATYATQSQHLQSDVKKTTPDKLILTWACTTNSAVKLVCKYLLLACAAMNFPTGCFPSSLLFLQGPAQKEKGLSHNLDPELSFSSLSENWMHKINQW